MKRSLVAKLGFVTRSLAATGWMLSIGCSAAEESQQPGLDAAEDTDPGEVAPGDTSDTSPVVDSSGDSSDTAVIDSGPADGSSDSPIPDVPDAPDSTTIAPPGAVDGELPKSPGKLDLAAGASIVVRVDGRPTHHIGARLDFTATDADVVLEALRWDGKAAAPLGLTDGGRGIRTLAAFDGKASRTYWFRVRAGKKPVSGTLTITETPFADGATCKEDCERLLQMPLPNDPRTDGYATTSSTIFRYQFGRRDMLMFVRHAGKTLQALGKNPFYPEDFSQWNGETPGKDVGSPRHASHQRGKDVDISLYGVDGAAPWRSYCKAVSTADGRECVAGSAKTATVGLDGATNARMFGDFFGSDRVTMMFLDRELIAIVKPAAKPIADAGGFDSRLLPRFSDGRHLQHWPNHDNHVHVRVSEEPVGAIARWIETTEVEAP